MKPTGGHCRVPDNELSEDWQVTKLATILTKGSCSNYRPPAFSIRLCKPMETGGHLKKNKTDARIHHITGKSEQI